MEMDSVLNSFARLCDSPLSIVIVAAMGLHAAVSILLFVNCPILRQRPLDNAAADRAAVHSPHAHSTRFLVTMLLGIALSVGGLYALRSPGAGPVAIGAIMVGVYVLMSEPARRTVEENALRVSGARLDGEEAYAFAHERLRAAHVERIATELGVFALLAVFIAVM
ncbi:hypothetical protein [Rubrimonas cliftonensis]|uniref:Uncharacterized protein n=1 Tax=Rubrimonas cliftonensis TaxID=89524 RepID=A0A1H3W5H3_9RHOB|nr:hypothetical protein [Rubrimonas cliftonensis]SDZ82240.1 hypothetical protein SAMN05444370_101525 [Rubrimonas cliftonensis]